MLEIQSLSFSYGSKLILSDIHLSLGEAKTGCLLSKNGEGKTTLMECILGLLKPKEGEIMLDGEDLLKMKAKKRARLVSYVPQDFHLPTMSLYDYLLLKRIPSMKEGNKSEDRKAVEEVIHRFSLQDFAFRDISRLSLGQKQKILVASSLLNHPRMIILDEPTASLDIFHQLEVISYLKDYQKESHCLLLMSLHDVNLALQTCDTFYLLKDNHVLYQGDKDVINEKTMQDTYDVEAAFYQKDDDEFMIFKQRKDIGK